MVGRPFNTGCISQCLGIFSGFATVPEPPFPSAPAVLKVKERMELVGDPGLMDPEAPGWRWS